LIVLISSTGGRDAVWGRFLDASGATLGSSFLISISTSEYSVGSGTYSNTGSEPRVAASGGGVFMVSYASPQPTGYSRLVQVVTYDALPRVAAPVTVDTGTHRRMGGLAWIPQTERFLVTWTKNSPLAPYEQEIWAMPVTRDGVIGTKVQVTHPSPTELSPMTQPEVAVGSNGTVLVVGWRDCSGVEWAGKCGIYYTQVDSSGFPIRATENLVYGSWSRFTRVVFNSASNTFQAMWIDHGKGSKIFGTRFQLDGTKIDAEPYLVKTTYPSPVNTIIGDDVYGEIGLAYEPVTGSYRMAFRGQDPPTGPLAGLAPVWRMVADSAGSGSDSSLYQVGVDFYPDGTDLYSNSPAPVVVSESAGNGLVLFRTDWSSLYTVRVTR
jgi:hypothetical protein